MQYRIVTGKQDNEIITKIHRLFLERIRKQTGKSVKHWCVTELGGNATERIHIHGILWGEDIASITRETWNYGLYT